MKKVIITIDTEGPSGSYPVEHMIWGRTAAKEEYGINYIMDICNSFSATALFFVDIAEAWDYDKEKIIEVIKNIQNRGHDVGIHIHPDHMADKSRPFLWEYSKEEQREIIIKCTNFYAEITGKLPIAFRAGKYGANRDTLDILDELGYTLDFSQFYGQKWCGINPPVAINVPQKYKGIKEIPVTVFKSFQFGSFKRYDKIDMEMDSSEFKHIMKRIADDDRYIIVSLFFHSFSLLDWRENPDQPVFNPKKEKKLIKALKYVDKSKIFSFTNLNLLISEEKDFYGLIEKENEIISTKGFLRSFYFTIKRAYAIKKFNKKARFCVNLMWAAISILSIILFITIRQLLCLKL